MRLPVDRVSALDLKTTRLEDKVDGFDVIVQDDGTWVIEFDQPGGIVVEIRQWGHRLSDNKRNIESAKAAALAVLNKAREIRASL